MGNEGHRPTGRAVIYLRVSYQGQVDNDYDPEGNSIPAQRKACRRKAEELGFEVLEEYVDPGRSALEVKNRPEFQRMMARIRSRHDVDYVIVYARSRMHRNATDALLTRRELKKLGVTLVSIRDHTEDSDMGDMIGTILDAVNEYQSRASGADVAYKMEAKAKNGGTPGAARLGYLNVVEEIDGRKVNTIGIDSERASFVKMLFELYATGKYSFAQLHDKITEAGLRTRSTKRFPGGREVSIHKIGTLLRDRYYLGYVIHKGQEYPGHHEPLLDQNLFDRVQGVLNAKESAGTRQRVQTTRSRVCWSVRAAAGGSTSIAGRIVAEPSTSISSVSAAATAAVTCPGSSPKRCRPPSRTTSRRYSCPSRPSVRSTEPWTPALATGARSPSPCAAS